MFQSLCFPIKDKGNLSINNIYPLHLIAFNTNLHWTLRGYYEWESFMKRMQRKEEILAIFETLYLDFYRKITFWREIWNKLPKYNCITYCSIFFLTVHLGFFRGSCCARGFISYAARRRVTVIQGFSMFIGSMQKRRRRSDIGSDYANWNLRGNRRRERWSRMPKLGI